MPQQLQPALSLVQPNIMALLLKAATIIPIRLAILWEIPALSYVMKGWDKYAGITRGVVGGNAYLY